MLLTETAHNAYEILRREIASVFNVEKSTPSYSMITTDIYGVNGFMVKTDHDIESKLYPYSSTKEQDGNDLINVLFLLPMK